MGMNIVDSTAAEGYASGVKRLWLSVVLLVALTASAVAQSSASGGASTGGSLPAGSVVNGIVQSGLIGQYAFTDNSGTTLTDSSGSGNNGTLCATTAAPTWVGAPTGGLTFNSANSQCVTLTSALNAAATIEIYANYQINDVATTAFFPIIVGGNGTVANTAALIEEDSSAGPGFGNTGTYGTPFLFSRGSNVNGFQSVAAALGTHLVSWVLDATLDTGYIDATPMVLSNDAGTAGKQTSGVYQLGGLPGGYVNGNTSFWSGTMYYALFYNRKLTAAEVAQNSYAVQQIMNNRSLAYVAGNTTSNNVYIIDGDSLPGANGAWLKNAFPANTDGTWQAWYSGISGYGILNLTTFGQFRDDQLCPVYPGTGNCILNIQIGTNNLGLALSTFLPAYSQFIAQRRAYGHYTQIWISTVLDNTNHAAAEAMNSALLQSWQSMGATGIIPSGEDPNLGCSGCNTGVYFAGDNLHPNALGQYEIAHIQQPNINRATNGNFNFSSANTYTTTASAATTLTAASEATNTVTFTMAATPASMVVGVDVTIAGVTPAGYNTSASNVCHLIGRSATQITCLNSATGLGAGTVFGTASTPMQLDIDAAVILAGSATTPSFTLQSCGSWVGGNNIGGWDGRVRIKNANTTSPWTITPFAAETIDGAASLAMPAASSGNNPVIILEAQALAPATGGCVWRRVQ